MHALGENRHGLIVGVMASEASGAAKRGAALAMLTRAKRRHRLKPRAPGADKGYDAGVFFRRLERRRVTPHVPVVKDPRDPKAVAYEKHIPAVRARRRMKGRLGAEGYALSQRCRQKIEGGIGWIETVAGLVRSRVVRRWELRQVVELAAAAYNLMRLKSLLPA